MSTAIERRTVTPARSFAATPKGPVRVRFTEQSEDSGILEIGVDYERATVPERSYYADYCEVVGARSGVSFVFGRLVPGKNILRTKVEISFPEDLFISQLWNGSRAFHEALARETVLNRLEPIVSVQETDKVQGFRSNNVFMAMLSDDSVLDFYYIAPPDIHFVRVGKRSDVNLEPVIRIVLSTPLLYDFMEQCRPWAERLKSRVRQLEIANKLEEGGNDHAK